MEEECRNVIAKYLVWGVVERSECYGGEGLGWGPGNLWCHSSNEFDYFPFPVSTTEKFRVLTEHNNRRSVECRTGSSRLKRATFRCIQRYASVMSKELKERVMSKAHAAVEGVVNKAHAVVEEIALQVVQDEVESPNMLGIDNARFLYEVGTDTKKCLSGKLPYLLASPPPHSSYKI